MGSMLRYSCLLCLLALLSGPVLQAQTPRPMILTALEVGQTGKALKLPVRDYQKQYLNRVYSGKIRKEIIQRVLEDLKTSGYYFAKIDSIGESSDPQARQTRLFLMVDPGAPLYLNTVQLQYRDSLAVALQSLLSQQSEDYIGEIYTEPMAKGLFESLIHILENNGYPLARAETAEFDLKIDPEGRWQLDLAVAISARDSIRLAYLQFPQQKSHLTEYLQRLLRFKPGQPYRQNRIGRYREILQRQEFIKSVDQPVLTVDKKGSHYLNIDFEEAPSTTFDGVIGYIPPPANDADASGYFTGLINIGVRNVFGGGRKMQIYWQKPDSLSDEFRVSYREPFLFGLPFHTSVGMYRLVRDITFVEWQYSLNFELPLSDVLSAFVNFATRTVVPNEVTNLQLGLPRTESLNTETGIRWDVRNNLLNPRSGAYLEMAFNLANQKNKGPDSLFAGGELRRSETLQRMRAEFGIYKEIFKRQVLSNEVSVQFLNNRGGALRLPDQLWFGGATSVRGFREDQFVGQRVAWMNSEYRFLLGPQSRFFIFSDNAWFESESPQKLNRWLNSYGFGLRFGGPVGIVQVDFGLERGAPFREAKLHFRVINEF